MKNIKKEHLLLFIVIFLFILVTLFNWSKTNSQNNTLIDTPTSSSPITLEKEEENVSVTIQYLPDKSDKNQLVFLISLNTHSVNFDSFVFKKDISLEKDDKILSPGLLSETGTGHHRQAELSFPYTPPPFTITIKNIVGIEKREFVFNSL